MIPSLCRCAECRAGDALPDRLQGWPGAAQLMLIAGLEVAAGPGVEADADTADALDPHAVVAPLL